MKQVNFWIAKKYFFSKKISSAVHLISGISIIGIAFGTMALIIVLSVFNGFETLIQTLFQSFDPDLKIISTTKYIPLQNDWLSSVQKLPEVHAIVPVLEGRAMLKYYDKQAVVHLKGVLPEFSKVSTIESIIIQGGFRLKNQQNEPMVTMGAGVAYRTNVNLLDEMQPMQLYTISEKADLLTNPEESVRQINVFPAGIFTIQKEYDEQFALTSWDVAEYLFETKHQASAFEIRLKPTANLLSTQQKIQSLLPSNLQVRSRYEQHQTMYQVMKNEKRVAFAIMALLILLTAANIVGSLIMVVLEKRKDIAILMTLGLNRSQIRSIFLQLGLMIGGIGGLFGLIGGFLVCLLQKEFGFLKLNGGASFIVDSFPVELAGIDFISVSLLVLIVSILASWFPSIFASRQSIVENLRQ